MSIKHVVFLGLFAALPSMARTSAEQAPVTIADEVFTSTVLAQNLIGLDLERRTKVYLPPGYAKSGRRYPVVYFLHNAWWGPRQMVEDGRMQRLLERGFAADRVTAYGGSPLLYAVGAPNVDVVVALLAAGAKVDDDVTIAACAGAAPKVRPRCAS